MTHPLPAALAFAASFAFASSAFAEVPAGSVPSQPPPSYPAPAPPPYAAPAPPPYAYAPPPYAYAPPLADPANETIMVRKRRSEAAFSTGVALDVAAGVSLLVGLVALGVTAGQHVDGTTCNPDLYCKDTSEASPALGLGFIVAGLATAAVGIPLTVYGGQRVRRPFAWAPTPGGKGLMWRF